MGEIRRWRMGRLFIDRQYQICFGSYFYYVKYDSDWRWWNPWVWGPNTISLYVQIYWYWLLYYYRKSVIERVEQQQLFGIFLNIYFIFFWWLFRLNKVILVKSENGNWVDYLLIVNVRSSNSGYFYFLILLSSWGWWNHW